jgi:hypothetical protein
MVAQMYNSSISVKKFIRRTTRKNVNTLKTKFIVNKNNPNCLKTKKSGQYLSGFSLSFFALNIK